MANVEIILYLLCLFKYNRTWRFCPSFWVNISSVNFDCCILQFHLTWFFLFQLTWSVTMVATAFMYLPSVVSVCVERSQFNTFRSLQIIFAIITMSLSSMVTAPNSYMNIWGGVVQVMVRFILGRIWSLKNGQFH